VCWSNVVAWAERYLEREIQRLHDESCRLREKLLTPTGEERVDLSPEERRRLWEKAKRIDAEILKQTSQDRPNLLTKRPLRITGGRE